MNNTEFNQVVASLTDATPFSNAEVSFCLFGVSNVLLWSSGYNEVEREILMDYQRILDTSGVLPCLIEE